MRDRNHRFAPAIRSDAHAELDVLGDVSPREFLVVHQYERYHVVRNRGEILRTRFGAVPPSRDDAVHSDWEEGLIIL